MLRSVVLALTVSAATAAPEAPPAPLVRYVLSESRKTVSPAGEAVNAVRGTVSVLGGVARWDLETGTFPRTSASSLVIGGRGGWLVDRKASVAARAGLADVEALFVAPAEGDAGPFQSTVRDVRVSSEPRTAGPAFQGRSAARHRISAEWTLVTAMPGRVGRIRSRLTAVLDVLVEEPEGASSPLDELGRLFDVPASVREALAPELAAVRGWPVGAVIETAAEESVDYPGAVSPQADGRAPLKTRVETARSVSALAARAAARGDAASFELPETTRVVGIERLVPPRETLR